MAVVKEDAGHRGAAQNVDRRRLAGARAEVNNILERWLMALVNTPAPPGSRPDWAHVYRRSTLDEPFNNKLAGELVEKRIARSPTEAGRLVVQILALVDRRLEQFPRPSGATPACADGRISYGSHFQVDMNPRIQRLIDLAGCEKALAVVLRYEAVVSAGQQWGLPQAHVDALYADFGVRNEAFASPLNSRLLGKPGARFCSLFPDTDAPYGSAGDFFAIAPENLDGNWVVNPPFVEDLLARAARHVAAALSSKRKQTFFFIMPAWKDSAAYRVLSECPFAAAEVTLAPGEYAFEDPTGARIQTHAASIYFALSTEDPQTLARLEGALRARMQ